MKILLISAHSAISGANKSMCILAEYLIQYGCDVTIALRKRGDIIPEIESRGLKYVILPNYTWTVSINNNSYNKVIIGKYIGNILAKCKIKHYLKEQEFDIVHNNSVSSFLIAECASEMGIKTVWHFREFLEEDHHLTISKLYNDSKIVNKAEAGIAISRSIFEKYSTKYKLPIELIYNGIEYTDFWCDREILQQSNITLAVIGRVCEGKNQLEVIKALNAMCCQGIENFKLHIIGDREEHSEYYKQIMAYLDGAGVTVKKHVFFDGIISDIATKYKEIDIVIVPSVSEAFGRVAIEAMYSGCYVVGANTAGTSEILNDSYSSKYELGNISELVSVLLTINNNREVYRDRARAGQRYAIAKFSAGKNASLIYALYKYILGNK